jgi:RNA polymerase sigma-70 factor (ECF subfamily)
MSKPDEIYDQWLVLRCQGGDSDAMSLLVQRWHPRLLSFATRLLSDTDSASDAVQSSWVEVVNRIGSINDPRSIRPWLFRIVANKCRDTIRKRVTRRKVERTVEADEIADPKREQQCEEERDREQLLKLRNAMEQLDSSGQELVRLFYGRGMPVVKIAKQLALPEGTVKSRLHHARRKLKTILKGDE